VLVGQIAQLHFGAYLLWALVPVFTAMTLAYLMVCWLGRRHFRLPADDRTPVPPEDATPFDRWRTIKGIGITVIIVILFFSPLPHYLVALTAAGLLLCSHRLQSKKVLSGIDWQLLLLFISLFVVVGAFSDRGLAREGVDALRRTGFDLNNSYLLALASGVLSNLINNSAAVMLLVKVVDFSNPVNGYALAMSNSFAGNLLLIGSMANIIVVQGAAQFGVKISFAEFARYGIPTAVTSFLVLLGWIAIA
ncbi:MAG: SLC13 family permease, partial [Victivallales bacterium]|nr:SLC13 family permease [Victivallales bacterium]